MNYKKQLSEFLAVTRQSGQLDEDRIIALKDSLRAEQNFEYYSYYMNMLCDHYFRMARFAEALVLVEELNEVGGEYGGYPDVYYHLMLGSYHWYHTNDIERLISCCQQALVIYAQSGLKEQLPKFLGNQFLGVAFYQMGDWLQAYEHLYIALNCRLAEVFKFRKAITYKWLGTIEEHFHNQKLALSYYQKSVDILKKFSLEKGACEIICNIGALYFDTGKTDLALRCWTESLEIAQKHKQTMVVADSYSNLGMYYSQMGEYLKATEYFDKALAIEHRPQRCAFTLALKGENLIYDNQLELAEQCLKESLKQFKKLDDTFYLVYNHRYLAQLFVKKADYKTALSHLTKAEKYANELSDKSLVSSLYPFYAECYTATKQYKKGLELFHKYIKLTEDTEKQQKIAGIEFDIFKNELERRIIQ